MHLANAIESAIEPQPRVALQVFDSKFKGNAAERDGAAMHVLTQQMMVVSKTEFVKNKAGRRAAVSAEN